MGVRILELAFRLVLLALFIGIATAVGGFVLGHL